MATHTGTFTPPRDRDLGRLLLQGDGVSCAALGALLLAGAAPIADFTGLPLAATIALGAAVLPYGVGLFLRARRHHDRRTLLTIAALNAIWVVASALFLLLDRAALTVGGAWAVGLLALFVADLAAAQFYAARRASDG